ncbi:MAG: hypothetical protein A3J62_02765 [Candidatus Buchananbacteria bacterium RIFCSPHIGHO2_02_FULL_38_8]|uniref:Multidrug ABC transporter substrate-binding protein n=2 Tax=Candidatus Buchananiibacteriota TaxID=1817903 RepID=A0A1G1XVK1_9BACT|nr:hypothetical protein [uncultured bacterium]OGY44058.1 MAG: hypothetical protein A2731_03860 [Candidatus Buchananbacteria bacterium RIFCSPHIGHO2_01_FULL_39_8]OGY47247.1 MAG: hypothetical protein A3J62_02765 [Candidatus Buchananbacteria bacterium RIFCSPHIGHO2_02_FULL_38_8]
MNLLESTKNSIQIMKAHKLRAFLTMLGMIIGISAVIIIMSVGAGAQSLIIDQISTGGSNLIGILPGAAAENGPPASVMGITVTTLTYEDAQALAEKKNVPHVVAAAAYVRGTGTAKWRNQDLSANFTGTTASYLEVENAEIDIGRFFDQADERSISRVAVLGSQIAKDLFDQEDPLGQEIKIKRESFKVIGVMKERGTSFFVNQDDQVFVPIKTAQKILLGINHINFARAKVDDVKNIDEATEDVKVTLRQRHDITNPAEDDFSIRNTQQAMEILTQVTNALKFFLVAIAAIALLVGGIGIMNIMLVAVNERIREIGLRKAVGAKRSNVISQFLIETIVVSVAGGLIGIMIGALFSTLIALVANYLGYSWALVISLGSIVLAFSFSAAVGLIFGVYPAWKAARLDPITALRYE